MSAINSNFDPSSSNDRVLDQQLAENSLGSEATGGQVTTPGEPPQEAALESLNEFTQAAYNHFNNEEQDGVPTDVIDAQRLTSVLVGGVVSRGTEALAAGANSISPNAVLSLLQD